MGLRYLLIKFCKCFRWSNETKIPSGFPNVLVATDLKNFFFTFSDPYETQKAHRELKMSENV